MKKKPLKANPVRRMLTLSFFLTMLFTNMPAQSAELGLSADKEAKKKDKSSEYRLYVETGFEYSDNVFRLTDSQISRMKANHQDDSAGGRFKGMDSISDAIIEPSIGFKLNSNSPLGGKFRLTSSITYNHYTKNVDSDFAEGRLWLNNSIGKRGDLTLGVNFASGFFKKNYLSSVNDLNHNGNIPSDERTYSSAIYDEYEGVIAYDYEIIKKKHDDVLGLNIEPVIGINKRMYNSMFNNRDQKITLGGLKAVLEVVSKFELEMAYQYENVTNPGKEELVLFDEAASGIDANGDGTRKENAPLVTRVDRSAKRYTIEIKPSYALLENCNVFLEYKRRMPEYTSNNQLDVEHYHVDATRRQFRSGVVYKFSKAWSAEAEYCRTYEDNDEDGNYLQNNFLVKLKYNIL
jgi:hypothetical protein